MRLASKIFLTATLVIVVLAGVGVLSLRAVDRLVSVNREITTLTVPALRLAAGAREAIAALTRLEARALLLRDRPHPALWNEPAARMARDPGRPPEHATSATEPRRRREALAAFADYRAVVTRR